MLDTNTHKFGVMGLNDENRHEATGDVPPTKPLMYPRSEYRPRMKVRSDHPVIMDTVRTWLTVSTRHSRIS